MLTPRSCCVAAVLPNDTLLVVGGRTSGAVPYKALKDIEIATVRLVPLFVSLGNNYM